ncbi:hypothetical protein HK102_012710 [Quaeritorhiza haematococci]|nr:hypothetical protein HK102_012710 [Quaeritorhiza haematococci]
MRNRKRKDPVLNFAQDLLDYMNAKPQEETMKMLARYFGGAESVTTVEATELDSTGFTLRYQEKPKTEESTTTEEAESPRKSKPDWKEVKMQFNPPLIRKDEIRSKITDFAIEAAKALNVEPNKNYIPPGRETNDKGPFQLPKQTLRTVLVTGWLFLILGTILPPHLFIQLFPFISRISDTPLEAQIMCSRILLGLSALHGIEALVAVGIANWAGLSAINCVKWGVSTFFFGIWSLRLCIRTAVFHAHKLPPWKGIAIS